MLGVVDSNLKMVKFGMQHLWMLKDAVVIWPDSCGKKNLRQGMLTSSICKTQQLKTRCNRDAKRTQHDVPKCRDMFRKNVPIV